MGESPVTHDYIPTTFINYESPTIKISPLYMLRLYSNLEAVKKKARYYNLNTIYESTRRNKKYMVFDGHKFIHFGEMGYEDYTKHHDKARLEAFRRRNWSWQYDDVYTPRWLSWHLLWS